MTKHIVKSFNLDHNKVTAPFVRLADNITSPKGDTIIKLDLRFCQPNKEEMDMPSMHTLEHLLATFLREENKYNLIDLSPMGCQTGFYITMFGAINIEEFKDFFVKALQKVLITQTIPGASEKECGNYKSHSLEGAKRWAEKFINSKIGII